VIGARARRHKQVVAHAQQDFAMHLEIVVEQQVERFVDAARGRVLHRHRAIIGRPLIHGGEDLLEGAAGQRLYTSAPKCWRQASSREGPMLALKGDSCRGSPSCCSPLSC
jgi:hypothetical protein